MSHGEKEAPDARQGRSQSRLQTSIICIRAYDSQARISRVYSIVALFVPQGTISASVENKLIF